MKATIKIYKDRDSNPIVLEKEHSDLNVLRHWQDIIVAKKSDSTMIVGNIDVFESFIAGRKEEWNL